MTTSETGETVMMEISRSDAPVPSLFRNIVEHLEASIDKSEIPPVLTIQTPEEYTFVSELVRQDKIQNEQIERTLGRFKQIAYFVHRAISGTMNRLQGYAGQRLQVREAALSDWARRDAERVRESERVARERAEAEERARVAEQAKQIDKQGDKQAAKELRAAPLPAVAVSVSSRVPKVAGQTIRKRWKATVINEEQLIVAIGRPITLLAAATALESAFGKRKAALFAKELRRLADESADVPFAVVDVKETAISKIADASNGKIDWPGVAVEEDTKTITRRR